MKPEEVKWAARTLRNKLTEVLLGIQNLSTLLAQTPPEDYDHDLTTQTVYAAVVVEEAIQRLPDMFH